MKFIRKAGDLPVNLSWMFYFWKMGKAKDINIKRLFIFFFSTLIYALSQMLFSIILMKEDLWNNFPTQLSAHYLVIFAMYISDYGLLIFLNKYIPYSRNIPFRILADLTGLTLICLVLLSVFNYLIYEVLLIPKEGLPAFPVKFAINSHVSCIGAGN